MVNLDNLDDTYSRKKSFFQADVVKIKTNCPVSLLVQFNKFTLVFEFYGSYKLNGVFWVLEKTSETNKTYISYVFRTILSTLDSVIHGFWGVLIFVIAFFLDKIEQNKKALVHVKGF